MQEAELHDLADDADYAASQQQGSASLMRSDSSRRSSGSEPDGAEVVYLQDNVTIHATQYASERISGRLKLIKQGPSLFMTWIPYKGQGSNAKLSERDRNLYTIREVPFTEVRKIHRHTPTIGWQYIIVVLSSGLAFPPFYFYNGGVREFLATIKLHVYLVRSAEDANVFLVNDIQDRLQFEKLTLELGKPRQAPLVSNEGLPHEQEKNGAGFPDEQKTKNKKSIEEAITDAHIVALRTAGQQSNCNQFKKNKATAKRGQKTNPVIVATPLLICFHFKFSSECCSIRSFPSTVTTGGLDAPCSSHHLQSHHDGKISSVGSLSEASRDAWEERLSPRSTQAG
ncbi:hypothetical protein Vadar_011136 [Vaccinium darrowii]|uniref:Uncharacterized protein n=1 Tax=Vaccinium darrowii TaxID=229202 RepID=A0ACB7YKX5_9ERIC|nr:hypothetical protein Vadar_011136 [Vaccinium darrowii]